MVVERHYLGSMPAAATRCFGVYLDKALVGAVVFTAGARNAHLLLKAGRPGDVLTLARLWLSDDLPTNSESRVIAVCLRALRREERWKAVITYADPAAGHTGVIYRAVGADYLGQAPDEGYLAIGGTIVHPRTVSMRLGSRGVPHLRRTGVDVAWVMMPGKYRYVLFLDPSWRWRLKVRPVPYPVRNERGPPSRPNL